MDDNICANTEIEYINTDEILKKIRNYQPKCYGDRPISIKMNPQDLRYLLANIWFPIEKGKGEYNDIEMHKIFGLVILEDEEIIIGEFKIGGIPRLKKWQ